MPIVDCGVSGGPTAAASGNLVCMCGGDPEVIGALAPLFDAIGSLTVTMGPFGTGLAAKLARNLVQYGGWLAAYEGQVLAEAAGIELAKLALVIRASDDQSGGPTTLMFRQTVAPFTEADDEGLVGAMQAAAGLAREGLAGGSGLGRRAGSSAAFGGHDRSELRRYLWCWHPSPGEGLNGQWRSLGGRPHQVQIGFVRSHRGRYLTRKGLSRKPRGVGSGSACAGRSQIDDQVIRRVVPAPLAGDKSAIGVQHGASDVARRVRREEKGRPHHFVDVRHPSE